MTRIKISLLALLAASNQALAADCESNTTNREQDHQAACGVMEEVSIFGVARQTRDIAGGASEITSEELLAFAITDVGRALRRVPGTSLQAEDGYSLRPNISIRGTPSERSSRITLLEDNVLIAPAPYAAPSAYYFPTFGRINSVEILKGPAGITQGPYTVGGALNMISTPLPARRGGSLNIEGGSDDTWRLHAWYGDQNSRNGWLLETHQWQSDGYQAIDRSHSGTGLDKSDYVAKFSFRSDRSSDLNQELAVKVQASDEQSRQSYLGLTDRDFIADPLRRYGLSDLDNMDNSHEQLVLQWSLEPLENLGLNLTAYRNETSRAWYKTEGLDADGSSSPESFGRTSWSSIIDAVNNGADAGGLDHLALQAILDGADTPPGSIQLRNNARDYVSQGVQLGGTLNFRDEERQHTLRFGVRVHRDEEDRMQRNDTYQQLGGELLLTATGLQGNAGNRIQSAEAVSFFIQDQIEYGDWTFTPGLRYENIRQKRIDFGANESDPSDRGDNGLAGQRENHEDFLIPGIGVLYRASDRLSLVAGAHRGFSAPGNKDGVEAEVSVNYEFGFRYESGFMNLEALAFYQDYENLQGICTASSGSDCEIGDAFNGNAVTVPGLELVFSKDLASGRKYAVPLQLSFTWMDAKFDSDISDSEFFGDVRAGDPVPYIPDQQLYASLGIESGAWSGYLSANYLDGVCTRASCGTFDRTESTTTVDMGVHYLTRNDVDFYLVVENLTGELAIAGRQPYGARPGKNRSWLLGARYRF